MKPITLDEALQSVGQGWSGLIRRIYESKPEDVQVLQVKEKFGSLRVYTDGVDSIEFQAVVQSAEDASENICELCGEPGSADETFYWIKTLCERHKEERKNRYSEAPHSR